jgi:hypothetical protein
MNEYYRVVVGDIGIYKAVDENCPRNDPRRENKPDGSWVNKIGKYHQGAISFWTDAGMRKYIESGLFDWHLSVVNGNTYAMVSEINSMRYQDEHQVLCNPEDHKLITIESIDFFRARFSLE